MKKGKVTITITIGIMCFILTMIIFIQINTIKQINVSELEIMRESELKAEITALKTKTNEVEVKMAETNVKIKEYEDTINAGLEAAELLESELQESEDLLGKTTVTGEGIIITLTSGEKKVNVQDLLDLVNQLKNAGAEAISKFRINGSNTGEPFVVKAIGNVSHLESGVAQKKYGYIDTKIAEGRNVVLEKYDSITIEPYTRKLDFEYVKEEE